MKFRCELQVGLYLGGQATASRPFKCTYRVNFPFVDSSMWWQDALGYIILAANIHREECLFLFSSRKNLDYTSWSHTSIPELITEAREMRAVIRGVCYMHFSGREREVTFLPKLHGIDCL